MSAFSGFPYGFLCHDLNCPYFDSSFSHCIDCPCLAYDITHVCDNPDLFPPTYNNFLVNEFKDSLCTCDYRSSLSCGGEYSFSCCVLCGYSLPNLVSSSR